VQTRWTFDEHLVSRKAPVAADNRLYVGRFEETAAVVALSASTGAEVWRTDLGDGGDVRFPESAAAIAGGAVVADFVELLVGFDRESGAVNWRVEVGSGPIHAPTAVDGVVYASVGGTGELYAIDSGTGHTRWRTSVGEWCPGGPAVVDGTVYAVANHAESGYVVALDAESGAELWRRAFSRSFATSPAVGDGALHVGDESGVVSLDGRNGAERWRFAGRRLSDAERHDRRHTGSAPTVDGGTVYTGSPDNRVYALDADSGAEEWEFWTWHDATGDPVVAGDTVYAGSDDTFVYAFDAGTGERRWEFDTGGPIDGAGGAVVDGVLYVSTWRDGPYALEEA
jgi:outer membrane protein assembly factor BamB